MVTSFYKTSFILLIFISFFCINLNAQNLIVNPDFSDVSVYYHGGKKVYPNHWRSFHWPFPPFEHKAKRHSEFPPKPGSIQKSYGVIWLSIINPSRGVFTELSEKLVEGQEYDVNVRARIYRARVASDFTKDAICLRTGEKWDPKDYLRNHVVKLIVKFHYSKPSCPSDSEDNLLLLEFPEGITPDYCDWIELSTTYIAEGGEKYFSIGTCSSDSYINYLRRYKSDSTFYDNKIARYLISYAGVLPVHKKTTLDITFFRSFDPDSVYSDKRKEKFIIRNITFEFDSYELNEVSKSELSGLASFLLNNPSKGLKIIGHTDTIGSSEYNQLLSGNRAKAVYSYLISLGIDENRLKWEGRGENEPLEGEHFIKNFRKYRRVEFEFR